MQFIYLRKNEKEKKDPIPVAKFIGMLNRIDPYQKSEVLQPYSVKLKFKFDQVLESKNKFAV